MKKICLLYFCSFCLLLTAQDSNIVPKSYLEAEESYRIGRFDHAIYSLELNLKTYNPIVSGNAYRLLSLCYLACDREDKAVEYIRLLLKHNPYYSVSLQDPPRFADFIKQETTQKITLVTASQQQETLNESPVPITLITEEMIKATGAYSLKDVLTTYIPGITSVESNEEMNIAMRGIYTTSQENILIMQDGQRLNSYITNAISPDYAISLDKIKQIEVLRGPASSLYGSVALTAVINIVTKNATDLNGNLFSIGTGNHRQFTAGFLWGKQAPGTDLISWFSIYSAGGESVFIPADEQYGIYPKDGIIKVERHTGFPSLDWGIKYTQGNYQASLNLSHSKKTPPYSMWLFATPYYYKKFRNFDGEGPGFSRTAARGQLAFNHSFSKFTLDTKMYIGWNNNSRYETPGDSIKDYPLIPPQSTDTIYPEHGPFQYLNWKDSNVGITTHANYSYQLGKFMRGTVLIGAEYYRYSLYASTYLEGMDYNEIIVTSTDKKMLFTGSEFNANTFLQIKHYFSDNLIINAGGRYDYKKRSNQYKIHAFSPRISLIYTQNDFNIKASYSKSFVDAPYYYRHNDLDTYVGGEDLKSEYLSSYQLTFSHGFKNSHIDLECNFFYNVATDFIYTQPVTRVYENAGRLDMGGVEFTTRYKYRRMNFSGNLIYQRVFDYKNYPVTRDRVYNIPAFTANMITGYDIIKNDSYLLRGYLRMCYSTKSHTEVTRLRELNDENPDIIQLTLPGYIVLSGNMVWEYEKLACKLTVNNLLNKKYESGGAVVPIRQKGRWGILTVGWKF